ncbi:MAG: hypothetical protein AB7S69_11125 [Salinivirgaceae bacterium]
MKKLYCLIVFLSIGIFAQGQSWSNLRQKTIAIADSVQLDSLSIVPSSLIVSQETQVLKEGVDFEINYSTTLFHWLNAVNKNRNTTFSYRVFPLNFSSSTKPSLIFDRKPEKVSGKQEETYERINGNAYPIDQNTLEVSGTIARGINVGNNQNMGLNSTLNLQIKGKLSEDVFIDAVMSDNSIPMQPDGYSQQINEFDQIYMRIYNEKHSLQIGDLKLNESNSYFLKFNRKVQGLDLQTQSNKPAKNRNTRNRVSAAVAKGSFNRMEFLGTEGIQGPYQLKGANNETFVVVLAGTEKVFLNGILLERGEKADYVMDYNTAELTFNPKHMINNKSRIIVEFEYSDKNYNRFLFYTDQELNYEKGSISVQYFTEGDAKNQPVNQEINPFEKKVLELAGDNIKGSVVQNIDSIAFDQNRVLYKMIDTLVSGYFYDSILVYSNHPDSAFYQAGFSLVGENRGNYIRILSATNGKMYQWIAPQNGIPQGNYEPVQLLIPPKKQQLALIKSSFKPTKNINIETELAYSQKDLNTFSNLDSYDNNGYALSTRYQQKIKLNASDLAVFAHYNFIHKHFNPLERFRPAEFEREWNLLNGLKSNEHYISSGITLSKKQLHSFSLIQEYLNKGTEYEGSKTLFKAMVKNGKLSLTADGSYLNTKGSTFNSTFYQHHTSLAFTHKKWEAGVRHQMEHNKLFLGNSDSLLNQSQLFSETGTFLNYGDSSSQQARIAYKNRIDFSPFQNQLVKSSVSDDVSFEMQVAKNRNNQLRTAVTWRNLNVINDSLLPNLKSEQNLLARLEHQLNVKKRLVTLYTFYEMGSGLESKKEYAYLEVAPGQGNYTWVDLNNNNQPELNEFELAAIPEEANYIKMYTPTSEYLKVYSVKLNETLKINPDALWKNETGIKKLASRFSNQLSLRIFQKHSQSKLEARMNPFTSSYADSQIISTNNAMRNTFSFNRSHPKFGADYTLSQQKQKSLLVNGFDESMLQLHELKVRWNLTAELLLLNTLSTQKRRYESEFFNTKNYRINSQSNSLTAQWQPGIRFRISLKYSIKQKENTWGNQHLLFQEISPELKYNSPSKGYIILSTAFINNRFKGDENTSAAYTMMEGNAAGKNFKWSVNITRNLNEFLRFTANYSGRKPADLNTIHTGQFSLVAFF